MREHFSNQRHISPQVANSQDNIICSTFAHHHHHSPWPPSAAFPQALGSQPDDKNVSTTNSLALYTFQRKFQIFSDHLFGLLEYVDKLCGVFAVLLGEEGVGGASVAFSPSSADPAVGDGSTLLIEI